ncbi:MAG: hypothetical protein OXE41_08380 [Gammaproteobacteria bacterium]|nr:hypothetical protein [Gammaproteobacteria bacterium]MCY4219985.1 hypothetical protein [Gammaproteobacteria bacterium]MCY4275391.1 hypothetical protein [Gammaproteobacteria bacterium]
MLKYSRRRAGSLRLEFFFVQSPQTHLALLATTAIHMYPAKISLLKFPLINKVGTHNIPMYGYLTPEGA